MPEALERIKENESFENRWHKFEQTVWVGLILLLAAGAAGYLGAGPKARRTASAGDGAMSLKYDRVMRARSLSELEVLFHSRATAGGDLQLTVAGALLDKLRFAR